MFVKSLQQMWWCS